jgi:CheY-like chemotaxis protein
MLPEREQILVVDDEPNLRRVLSAHSFETDTTCTAEDGEQASASSASTTSICHHRSSACRRSRYGAPPQGARHGPELPVVMITAHGTVDNAVEALKTGAFDYITKPFDQAEVRVIVKKALSRATSPRERRAQVAPSRSSGTDHRASSAIQELYSVLDRVADTPTTVLVTGESGTGKGSSRAPRRFLAPRSAVHQSELRRDPHELIERALRLREGRLHRRGRAEAGPLRAGGGGNLFLDEIGTIPVEMQVKLLRALQEASSSGSGASRPFASTCARRRHQHGSQKIAAGHFREICTTASTWFRFASLPEEERTTRFYSHAISSSGRTRLGKHVEGIERSRPRAVLHPWPGTSGSSRTSSSGRCSSATAEGPRARSPARGARRQARHHADSRRRPPSLAGDRRRTQQVKAASRLERELIVHALDQTRATSRTRRLLKISARASSSR